MSKIAVAKRGPKFGHIPWNKGKRRIYTESTRKKMSEGQLRLHRHGSQVPSWRGGSWLWKQAEVKKRDHFTCVKCGLYDPDIVVAAHKLPIKGIVNRLNNKHPLNSLENLVTLCPNCHVRYDKGLIEL